MNAWQAITTIVVSILGSTGVCSIVLYKMQRKDKKADDRDEIKQSLEDIQKRLEKAEKDNLRLQMLALMKDEEENTFELMTVGEHYFSIGGNWYMTTMFSKWLQKHNLQIPTWFNTERSE